MNSRRLTFLAAVVTVAALCLPGWHFDGPRAAGQAARNPRVQRGHVDLPPPLSLPSWDAFRKAHPGQWRLVRKGATGPARMIYGGRTRPYGRDPRSAALAFLGENSGLLGIDDRRGSLRHTGTLDIPAGRRVSFVQLHDGIEVLGAGVMVVLDGEGRVLHVTNSLRAVGDPGPPGPFGAEDVLRAARRRFPDQRVEITAEPRPVIHAVGRPRRAHLTWLRVGDPGMPWRLVTDDASGEVLQARGPATVNAEAAAAATARLSGGGPADPDSCDREWFIYQVDCEFVSYPVLATIEVPPDSFYVEFQPFSNLNQSGDKPLSSININLNPCIEYGITFEYELSVNAWHSFPWFEGIFYFNINPEDYFWNLRRTCPPLPIDLECADFVDTSGTYAPGQLWLGGGAYWGQFPCVLSDRGVTAYLEADNTKRAYASLGWIMHWNGDHAVPCVECPDQVPGGGTATFRVNVSAQSHVFAGSPVAYIAGPIVDLGDADAAVPCAAYLPQSLRRLTPRFPWRLEGDFARIVDLAPPGLPTPESFDGEWPRTRSCDEFEAVMCYHHVTENQLRIQQLGFTTVNSRQLPIDPHGWGNTRNAAYIVDEAAGYPPGSGYLVFGDGGVDSGEDPDVILHEYAHAVQDNQRPGVYHFGGGLTAYGDETHAMSEGFADYWACSSLHDQSVADGMDPAGYAEWFSQRHEGARRVDSRKIYPDSMNAAVGLAPEPHADGQLWSACLWDLSGRLGRDTADRLVLDHHFLVAEAPTFGDGVRALVASDASSQFKGANRGAIIDVFRERGVLRLLEVHSIPDAAWIYVGPPDVTGAQGDAASFTRYHAFGDTAWVSAPSTHLGNDFKHWILDNVKQPDGLRLAPFPLTDPAITRYTAHAVFEFDTPAGADVVVEPVDATTGGRPVRLLFDIVIEAGNTLLRTGIIPGPAPFPGAGPGARMAGADSLVLGCDLSTTAVSTGDIAVTVSYDDTGLGNDETRLRLLRFDAGQEPPAWIDATTSQDVANNRIMARVDAVAPLALVVRQGAAPVPQAVPPRTQLLPAVPNPFNPRTVVAFALQRQGRVRLEIYDLAGRRTRTLLDEWREAGRHETAWDGRDDAGRIAAAGAYLVRLESDGLRLTRKIMLVR